MKFPTTRYKTNSYYPSPLENWVRAFKAGKPEDIGSPKQLLAEIELELDRVRLELAQVKQERDILRKAAAYFWVSQVRLPAMELLHTLRDDKRAFI